MNATIRRQKRALTVMIRRIFPRPSHRGKRDASTKKFIVNQRIPVSSHSTHDSTNASSRQGSSYRQAEVSPASGMRTLTGAMMAVRRMAAATTAKALSRPGAARVASKVFVGGAGGSCRAFGAVSSIRRLAVVQQGALLSLGSLVRWAPLRIQGSKQAPPLVAVLAPCCRLLSSGPGDRQGEDAEIGDWPLDPRPPQSMPRCPCLLLSMSRARPHAPPRSPVVEAGQERYFPHGSLAGGGR